MPSTMHLIPFTCHVFISVATIIYVIFVRVMVATMGERLKNDLQTELRPIASKTCII